MAATATDMAGIKSRVDVESNPVVPMNPALSRPHIWSYIWFVLAVLVVLGFHIRVFGRPIPPATNV